MRGEFILRKATRSLRSLLIASLVLRSYKYDLRLFIVLSYCFIPQMHGCCFDYLVYNYGQEYFHFTSFTALHTSHNLLLLTASPNLGVCIVSFLQVGQYCLLLVVASNVIDHAFRSVLGYPIYLPGEQR